MRFHAELRAADVSGNTLAGHANVFGQHAEMRGGWETMAPHAFDRALKRDNVYALVNHNPSLVLGSTGAGTLQLRTDDTGLAFEVELPDTSYARDLRELVARGDLAGCSFGFLPGPADVTSAPDGRQLRTYQDVRRLLDVSVVTYPAYEGTDVSLRSVEWSPATSRKSQLILARHRARTIPGGTRQ